MSDTITTPLRCFDCGYEWIWKTEEDDEDPAISPCPKCGSSDVFDPITSDLEPDADSQAKA